MGEEGLGVAAKVAGKLADLAIDDIRQQIADRRDKDLHAAKLMENHNAAMNKAEVQAGNDFDRIVAEHRGVAGTIRPQTRDDVAYKRLVRAVQRVMSPYEPLADEEDFPEEFESYAMTCLDAAGQPLGPARLATALGSLVLLLDSRSYRG
jgi:hypothetical protein